ncbi:ABC transporter ATP-binding protein [Micromonospora craniellae]|uniref:ABC transporter ATP-binding protein n=1 Tax=Micromonospora craniellae TaxID=2294034 RepID=A0A372G5J1_9ACTN|nr:ABC transporter ATP-binding protein [Micromonospora craniellae]QOC90588.1 ABC transporter ATP-binding protein [Micromonospora craniellae]RFS48029.1 ABC transporter ATP-binding protein [Micromonospora craniellae]
MSDDVAIRVRGLRKAYGDNVAVADLDLDVHRGEVFALLGPNGAGKTTTVEILEGYRQRDAGEVRVLGTDPSPGSRSGGSRAPGHSVRDWRGRVGIVLQGTGEFDELTVAEVVHHFAGFYPHGDDPDKVIDRVGLTAKAGARTHTLSGGQKRRLDVALGIIGRPELLFLDEPTTGFDPEARREFWELIRDLSAAGTTIVLTTHYLDEAETLADRVGVIAGGRLVEVAVPAELGNRREALATVSWRTPEGAAESAQSATPTALVTELAARFGGEAPGLTVTRPTLEDIYLRMIGHR